MTHYIEESGTRFTDEQRRVEREILEALREHPILRQHASEIDVKVSADELIVSGTLQDEETKMMVERLAASFADGRLVHDHLHVLPLHAHQRQ